MDVMTQRKIPAVLMRGGTSKGLFFRADALPQNAQLCNQLLLRAIGSPDPYGKQIDGMGGATSSTSKTVILSRSTRDDHDVDYLFGQQLIRGNADFAISSGFLFCLIPMGIAIRLGTYLFSMRSPMNFWGRLLTFRWIIPGYDQVLLGPLVAAFAPFLCLLLPQFVPNCTQRMVGPVANGLFLFLITSTGPALRRWQLTAPASIAPSQTTMKTGKQLQEI